MVREWNSNLRSPSLYYFSLRLCLLQEITKRCSTTEQSRSSHRTINDLIEDVAQLLRQSHSTVPRFCPSIIVVYATAIAISCSGSDIHSSTAQVQQSTERIRSLALLQSLRDLGQVWHFAKQVYGQFTPRTHTDSNILRERTEPNVETESDTLQHSAQMPSAASPDDVLWMADSR